MATGAENAAAIENLQAMGFERDAVNAAMRAAFFNPDRAYEYLLTVSITRLPYLNISNFVKGHPRPSTA